MKKRVYLETSVVSYFTASPSRDILVAGHQEATHEIWPELETKFNTFISALVYEEAGKGDPAQAKARLAAIRPFPMLEIHQEAEALAEHVIADGGIPSKFPEDALHIAVAAAHGIDIVLTWNIRHLNNPFSRKRVRGIVKNHGYVCPEICSPEELLEAES